MWYSSTVSSEKLLTLSEYVFHGYAFFTLSWCQKENVFTPRTQFPPKLNFIPSSLGWFSSLQCLKNIIAWNAVIRVCDICSYNVTGFVGFKYALCWETWCIKLVITIQVLYKAVFLPDKIWHVFKDRSYLFPHHLTGKHNVTITLCDCFCTYSAVALPAGSTSNSSIQIKIAWS